MKAVSIPASVFKFLHELSEHNEREWFNAHKDQYTEAHEHMIAFADDVREKMNKHDHLVDETGRQSLFRIYADTRFSKDKSPYKTYWGGRFKRATKKLRGGYYFHIEPGNSYVAGGFFGPNPADLKRIREYIDMYPEDFYDVLQQPSFIKTFNKLQGEQVLSAPKGYPKDHQAIALLRYKQFIIKHQFTDKEVLSKDFASQVSDTFKQMRPFFDLMSEILTTDHNGVSTI